MRGITKFVIADILKNRIILFYALILGVFSWSIFSLEDNTSKGIMSLLNIILLTVPLVSIIFSNIYMYNSAEFIELLVSQPVKRSAIWTSLFIGLAIALNVSFLVGIGIPVLLFVPFMTGMTVIITGMLITTIFVSIAMLCSILMRDKARGIFSALNPIDLARIQVLLQVDVAALMGYTGAIFKKMFGTMTGYLISLILMLLWIVIPFLISLKLFNKKDL